MSHGPDPAVRFIRKQHPNRWVQWATWLGLAVVLHVLFLILLVWLGTLSLFDKDSSKKPPNRHVVQLYQDPTKDEPPDTAGKHVSTENHKAEKNTVAEKPQKDKTPVPPKPKSVRKPRPRPVQSAPPVALEPSPTAADSSAKAAEIKNKAEETEAQAPVKLFPTAEEADEILGIKPQHAPPPDLTSGRETSINSHKWLGASFFLRVREAVAQEWDPETPYRHNDPDGKLFGFKNWFTVLSITLDAQGRLLEPIIIAQPSGLRFLDIEAMRAVRAAAPFANPPKEIVDPVTGRIKFRFGFLVEINSGFNFRMFRF